MSALSRVCTNVWWEHFGMHLKNALFCLEGRFMIRTNDVVPDAYELVRIVDCHDDTMCLLGYFRLG